MTIGHSRHSLELFLSLLERAQVTAVADVRSAPVSRFSPHFNRNALVASLARQGIDYAFLGREFGGRPAGEEMYTQGRVDYEKMALSPEFRAGLARLIGSAERHCVAAMCSEADPLDYHRCLLVGRALTGAGIDVGHILASGEVVTHAEAEEWLLDLEHRDEPGLLMRSRDERVAEAYRSRCRRLAYARSTAPRGGAGYPD